MKREWSNETMAEIEQWEAMLDEIVGKKKGIPKQKFLRNWSAQSPRPRFGVLLQKNLNS